MFSSKKHFIMYLLNKKNYFYKKNIRRKKQVAKQKLIVLNAFSDEVKILWVLFTKNTVKPVKTTTLGTMWKRLSWTDGRLIKHLYKTATNQMWSFLPGFCFFSNGNVCLNKDLQLRMFWCHFEDGKCFKLLFILNVHILRGGDGCFTITQAPKLKVLLFYQSKF